MHKKWTNLNFFLVLEKWSLHKVSKRKRLGFDVEVVTRRRLQ